MSLSGLLLVPLVAAVAVSAVPRAWARALAIAAAVFECGLALGMVANFEPGAGPQFVERAVWMPGLGIHYAVGLDGLNLLPVMLTTSLLLFSVLLTRPSSSLRGQLACLLLLHATVLGALVAVDLVFLLLCCELAVLPGFFLIGGGPERRQIHPAVRFFMVHTAGSVLLAVAVIGSAVAMDGERLSFDTISLVERWHMASPRAAEFWLFLAFAGAFAVKGALVPLHGWLTDAAAVSTSAVSVGLLGFFNLGAYGLCRFAFGLFPRAAVELTPVLGALAVVSIFYAAFAILAESSLPRLTAFASVGAFGLVVLGALSATEAGLTGVMVLLVGHALAATGLAVLSAAASLRWRRSELASLAGMPRFGVVLVLCVLGIIGAPGFLGFVGEIMVLFGTFRSEGLVIDVPTTKLATFVVALAGMLGVGAVLLVALALGKTDPPLPVSSTTKSIASASVLGLMGVLLFPPVDDFEGGVLVRPLAPYIDRTEDFAQLMPVLAVVAVLGLVAVTTGWVVALRRCWALRDKTAAADLSAREMVLVLPLVAMLLVLGLSPQPLVDRVQPTARDFATEFRRAANLPEEPVRE